MHVYITISILRPGRCNEPSGRKYTLQLNIYGINIVEDEIIVNRYFFNLCNKK